MTDLAGMATAIRACLDSADPDSGILDLLDQPLDLAVLENLEKPHPLIGLAARLGSGALLRRRMPDRVAALLCQFSDALAPAGRQGEGYWRIVDPFPCLFGPLIDAACVMKDQKQAISLLNDCRNKLRRHGADRMPNEPLTAALIAHPNAAKYGPLLVEPGWLLDRYEQALALGPLDHRLAEVQTFHAGLVETALLAETPQRALPLIEQELDWYLSCDGLDTSHFEFNAICALAALRRFQDALASAKRLVRRGYPLAWRFHLDSARQVAWTQAMRQNEWLGKLAETAEYRQFLEADLPGGLLGDDPASNPLCLVRDGEWTGKKPGRCHISRQKIEPGEPVVRFRLLFNRSSDGDLEMAAQEAFAASPWQASRRQFEADAIPVALLFPRGATLDAKLDGAPHIHAFAYDVARDPRAFDIARAVALIADHAPPPIDYSWDKGDGTDRWVPAFPPFAGADGHGDAVNLAWRIVKAGYRDAMLAEVSRLPGIQADKVFAMLATFDDVRMRQAAAAHFDLPDLPGILRTVFKGRLSLDDHEALAIFGDQARFRAGLVAAMRAYGLHLYSNYHPKADWFLAGLEHYARAGGSALLYFLIDHPEDDPILATMIDKSWLPDKAGGSIDDYANARPFYVRAALFHLARHQPERLDAWLTPEAARRWNDMAYDRETLRLIQKHPRRPRGQGSHRGSA